MTNDELQDGDRVEVYWNLHKDCFSVRKNGRVVDYLYGRDYLTLTDVKFVVQPAGRERVLRERKKNVHAFVRGHVTHTCNEDKCLGGDNWGEREVNITYNPYREGYFFVRETGMRIDSADMALLELTDRNVGKITGFFQE